MSEEAETKQFHLMAVLSVTTGFLLAKGGMGDVYDVLDFLEGHAHMTHELLAASERVTPHILEQLPLLKDVHPPLNPPYEKVESTRLTLWMNDMKRIHGTHVTLRPIAQVAS